MNIFQIGSTTVYMTRIAPTDRAGRRHAEVEAVRCLLVRAFGPEVRLSHGADGAPFIDGMESHISITHGAGLALLAVDPMQPIGIDVECWRPSLLNVASRVLDAEEQAACGEDPIKLLRAWTAKEAIFKAAGVEGLTLPEIRLPGNVGERNFCVRFIERKDKVFALAKEIAEKQG